MLKGEGLVSMTRASDHLIHVWKINNSYSYQFRYACTENRAEVLMSFGLILV